MINYRLNKYNTCSSYTIVYTFPLQKEDMPAIMLLSVLLEKKGPGYDDARSLYISLQNLYGSTINLDFMHVGEVGKLLIHLNVPSPKYVKEDNLEAVVHLAYALLNNQNEERYDRAKLQDIKKEIINHVREKENRPLYMSSHRAIWQIDDTLLDSYSTFVSSTLVESITISDIKKVHQRILQGSCTIYYEGPLPEKNIKKLTEKYFIPTMSDACVIRQKLVSKTIKSDFATKKSNPQSAISLVFGLNLEETSHEAAKVYQYIMEHLLFRDVRENKGYCYSISARVDYVNQLLYIDSLVGNDVVKLAIEAIKAIVGAAHFSPESLGIYREQYLEALKQADTQFRSRVAMLETRKIMKIDANVANVEQNLKKVKIAHLEDIDHSANLLSVYYVLGGDGDEK